MKESLVCKKSHRHHIQSQQTHKRRNMKMDHEITQEEMNAAITRAHELRSLAFFNALAALTSPFKASTKSSPMGAALPA